MTAKTVLEIVKDVLNDISGDEIDSINDTVESVQVAAIVQSTYEGMITSRNWPHTKSLVTPLPDYTTEDNPTSVIFPQNLKELIFLKYDKSKVSGKVEYEDVRYLDPDNFLRRVNQRNTTDSNVVVVTDPSGIALHIYKNSAPQYYTSFNDSSLVLDSFDSSIESFLNFEKFQAYGYLIPEFTLEDGFYPILPVDAFPSLIEEVKSRAALKLRQQPDQKAEQESQRQRRYMARKDWVMAGGIKFPNYGRSANHSPLKDPTFRRDN